MSRLDSNDLLRPSLMLRRDGVERALLVRRRVEVVEAVRHVVRRIAVLWRRGWPHLVIMHNHYY